MNILFKNNKKIAILYISLGRYDIFWDSFYTSAEKYLLKNYKKTYFVFTDSKKIKEQTNVIKIPQEKLGWPYDTMLRFQMFLTQEDKLKDFDYIFFFNGNTKFIMKVGEEILPKTEGLVSGRHPAFRNKGPDSGTYERNPKSTSYVPFGAGKDYVQCCLLGGRTKEFLEMSHWCDKQLKIDLGNNIIPIWHDESIVNKYILDKEVLILPSNYLWQEAVIPQKADTPIKIMQLDKTSGKYGGLDYLRGKTDERKPYYDIVICPIAKDYKNLHLTKKQLKKNYDAKNVIVLSRGHIFKEKDCIYIDTNKILEGLTPKAIKNYFKKRNIKTSKIDRYLQQFLEMAYCFICKDPYYLVWDANTLMLTKQDFLVDNKIAIDNSRIWKDDALQENVFKVLGFERKTAFTYRSEHMLIKTDIMKELIAYICKRFNVETKEFWTAILDTIPDENLIYGDFSAFEILGTYLANFHADEITFKPQKTHRIVTNNPNEKINKQTIGRYKKDYDFITQEIDTTSKPKG